MTSGKVLFVDNTLDVVDELAGELRKSHRQWQVKGADSTNSALALMQSEFYDVVVTELTLPGKTGLELLEQVAELYPGTVRIVLSASGDRQMAIQTAGLAHRFIAKPVDVRVLLGLLDISLGLREMFDNEELHARIARIGSLPSPPEIYEQLTRELQSEACSTQKVADLVGQDVALTAKILQMINSAFFGLPSRVDSLLQAVNLLGLDTVKGLVLTAGVFREFREPGQKLPGLSIESIYHHSVAVGTMAQRIALRIGLPRYMCDDALLAGMLHDIGKLMLLTYFPEELKTVIAAVKEENLALERAEERVTGVTHAQMGAHLLSLWGLPDQILEAVALHHVPSRMPCPVPSVLTAVHIANCFEDKHIAENSGSSESGLDMRYLEAVKLSDRLDDFRELCEAGAIR